MARLTDRTPQQIGKARPGIGRAWLVDADSKIIGSNESFFAFDSLPGEDSGDGPALTAAAEVRGTHAVKGPGWRVVTRKPMSRLPLASYETRRQTELAALLAFSVAVLCLGWLHLTVLVAATSTDGARTAVLTGPSRTFTEPHTTKAKIVTDSWVRLMPKAWKAGTEKEKWFTDWFAAFHHSTRPDLLAISLQYVKGAPRKKDRQGLRYAGPATFGPPDPHRSPPGGPHRRPSDFYHYLGRPWTFPDRKNALSDKSRYGAVDSSGYVRLVYGYRGGYALLGTDRVGPGLPRTAKGIASVGPGVPVIPHRGTRPSELDTLQPGDLLFFDTDRQNGPRLDHMGIYLGLDTDGHPRFLSSRERNNGPTFGDAGGSSRIDGAGIYANSLREAKRL